MPPRTRRTSRASAISNSAAVADSAGSLAAKRVPDPSGHSAILTALEKLVDRQDPMEERLSALSPAPTAAVPTTVAPGIIGGSSVPAPVLPVSAVPSLGSALPVPSRIRDRITRGEFIVFDELLTESLAAPPELHLALTGDGLVKIDRATTELKRKVCNLQTWLEAWTVYCRILCDAAPERIQDLLFYQGTIVEASSKYSSDAWLTYDRRFRMALAAQPHAFSWRTIDYYDRVLPFGLRSAPFIFDKFADSLQWILQNTCKLQRILHCLDDFLDIAGPSKEQAQKHHDLILEMFKYLDVPVAPEKVEGPSTSLTFLGIELDTVNLEMRLPADKKADILAIARNILATNRVNKRELASVVGKLSFASRSILAGRTFL